MGQIIVRSAAVLDAPAEDVYATLADYRQGHPRIIPREIYDLQVEQGGYGAGTVIRFKMRVLGVEQPCYQQVSEPEPGRVLVEQDIASERQAVTTFRVTPLEQGHRSHVEISTTMRRSPGVRGLVEHMLISRIFPRIYQKELKLLEGVARDRTPQGQHSMNV